MKLNLRSVIMALGIVALGASASVPNGYYSTIYGKKGTALKTAIHEVIRPHTQLTYSSLWNHFPYTDVYPEKYNGKSLVWDMYSDNKNSKKYLLQSLLLGSSKKYINKLKGEIWINNQYANQVSIAFIIPVEKSLVEGN